jgi:hypothetical protein
VIGRNVPPSAWDEDVLLRAYHEGLDRLIPRAARLEEPMTPIDGWDGQAERLIDEARSLRLIHPAGREIQRLLVESMTVRLLVGRGDRSEAARTRQAATATALVEAWRRRVSAETRE